MAKILIIVTGGTFGSCANDGVRNVDQSDSIINAEIKRYQQKYPGKAIFDVPIESEPKILSENITVGTWDGFVKLLQQKHTAEKLAACDGLIVTHGTDTLAYTAALFSTLLKHLNKPVVFVSSDAPLDGKNGRGQGANGRKNFTDAVNFICEEFLNVSGVFVAYSYDLKRTVFYRAEHITQALPFTDNFSSCTGHDFAIYKDNKLTVSEYYKKLSGSSENLLDKIVKLENNVLLVMPYVGLDYSRINLQGLKAVLHGTYHSFTMCLNASNTKHDSVDYLYEKCREMNIAFYFASYDESTNPEPYETTKHMLAKGARFILNSGTEFAYTRLLVGHNIQKEQGYLGDKLLAALNLKLFSNF
ncbi:MAG: asparaginase [Defluviitaleaceae bacterium]|nr:asparaginase [Defluviitaleaceae bacterium]